MRADVLVTQHPALVDVLKELGVVSDDVKVIKHATPEDITNKVVAGILPLSLASLTKAVITTDLRLKPEDRGRELTTDELKEKLIGVSVYKVEKVSQLL